MGLGDHGSAQVTEFEYSSRDRLSKSRPGSCTDVLLRQIARLKLPQDSMFPRMDPKHCLDLNQDKAARALEFPLSNIQTWIRYSRF